MAHRHYIIPMFVPDLGCPNRCVFCNQKKITGQLQAPEIEEITAKITSYLSTISTDQKQKKVEIAFYGGSFTAIPVEVQEKYLGAAFQYVLKGLISGIRISTRPDKIDEKALALLKSYGVKTIELGVQSLDPVVLEKAKRGHSPWQVSESAELIKSWGFFLGIQLMIGLPGDSQEKVLKTCGQVTEIRPDFVRIYPVLVLKGTELENMYRAGAYIPWALDQIVDTAKKMVSRFERAGIDVIRIGLQSTEEISPQGEVVAGPYHPAMGELVYAALALEQMRQLFKRAGAIAGSFTRAELRVAPKDESKIRGQRSKNIELLKAQFGLDSMLVVPDPRIELGEIELTAVDELPLGFRIRRQELDL